MVMTSDEKQQLILDLAWWRRAIEKQKGGAYITPLQIQSIERDFKQRYGVELKIETLSDFGKYEQKFINELEGELL